MATSFPTQLCKSPPQPRLLASILKTGCNQIIRSPASGFQKSALFVKSSIGCLSSSLWPLLPGASRLLSAGLAAAWPAMHQGCGASTCLARLWVSACSLNGAQIREPSWASAQVLTQGPDSPGGLHWDPQISSNLHHQPSALPDTTAPPNPSKLAAASHQSKPLSRQVIQPKVGGGEA